MLRGSESTVIHYLPTNVIGFIARKGSIIIWLHDFSVPSASTVHPIFFRFPRAEPFHRCSNIPSELLPVRHDLSEVHRIEPSTRTEPSARCLRDYFAGQRLLGSVSYTKVLVESEESHITATSPFIKPLTAGWNATQLRPLSPVGPRAKEMAASRLPTNRPQNQPLFRDFVAPTPRTTESASSQQIAVKVPDGSGWKR